MRKKVVQMSKLQLSSSYPKNIFQKSKIQWTKKPNEPKNNPNKPKNSSNDRKDSSNEHKKIVQMRKTIVQTSKK